MRRHARPDNNRKRSREGCHQSSSLSYAPPTSAAKTLVIRVATKSSFSFCAKKSLLQTPPPPPTAASPVSLVSPLPVLLSSPRPSKKIEQPVENTRPCTTMTVASSPSSSSASLSSGSGISSFGSRGVHPEASLSHLVLRKNTHIPACRPVWMHPIEKESDVIGNMSSIQKIIAWLRFRFERAGRNSGSGSGSGSCPSFAASSPSISSSSSSPGGIGKGAGLVIVAPPGVGSSSVIRICARNAGADVTSIPLSSVRTLRDATLAATKEACSGFSHTFMKLVMASSSSSHNPTTGGTKSQARRGGGGGRSHNRYVIVLDHADAIFSTADSSDSAEEERGDRLRQQDRGGGGGSALEGIEINDGGAAAGNDITFQKWALHKNVKRQAPIIIIVSNTNSKALRALAASPGWDKIHMYPLTVKMTAMVALKLCQRLNIPTSYETTQKIGRSCAGDARQVTYRVAFPETQNLSQSSVCQQLAGNMFQACSFLLTDGRSVGRQDGTSSRERLLAMASNPRVPEFTQANYARMLAAAATSAAAGGSYRASLKGGQQQNTSPRSSTSYSGETTHLDLESMSNVNEAFSNMDINGMHASASRRVCAEVVAASATCMYKRGRCRGDFFPEYHEREMHHESLEKFDAIHLLAAATTTPRSNSEEEKKDKHREMDSITFCRRSGSEVLDYDAVHWDAIRESYGRLSRRESTTITYDQHQTIEHFLEIIDKRLMYRVLSPCSRA